MLRHLLAAGSLGVLLVTTLICSATSSAASVELKHQLEGPCVSPITNNKIGQTKIGTDVCLDGKVQDPNKKDEKDDNNDGSDQSNQSVSSDEESATVCDWYPLDEDMSSTRWGSNSPGDGHLEGLKCYPRDLDLTKQGEGGGSALVDTRFVPNAGPIQPVAPPPPDPAVLAEQAYSELEIPPPTIGAGPDRTKLAVNLWTWLWVDNPGPLTNTVTAGGISVTVIAVLSSVDWSLGEPTTAGHICCRPTGEVNVPRNWHAPANRIRLESAAAVWVQVPLALPEGTYWRRRQMAHPGHIHLGRHLAGQHGRHRCNYSHRYGQRPIRRRRIPHRTRPTRRRRMTRTPTTSSCREPLDFQPSTERHTTSPHLRRGTSPAAEMSPHRAA